MKVRWTHGIIGVLLIGLLLCSSVYASDSSNLIKNSKTKLSFPSFAKPVQNTEKFSFTFRSTNPQPKINRLIFQSKLNLSVSSIQNLSSSVPTNIITSMTKPEIITVTTAVNPSSINLGSSIVQVPLEPVIIPTGIEHDGLPPCVPLPAMAQEIIDENQELGKQISCANYKKIVLTLNEYSFSKPVLLDSMINMTVPDEVKKQRIEAEIKKIYSTMYGKPNTAMEDPNTYGVPQ